MATIKEQLESIGDAIRLKTGGTALLSLEEMAQELNNIPEKSAQDLTFSGSSVIVPAGNYKEQAVKEIATSELNEPTITVNSNGKITATVIQEEGYIAADNPGEAIVKTSDYQLPTKAAQTITPGKTNITIAANTYLTGVQTIKGDSNLVANNIVSGKTIFGVAGNYNPTDAVLNFKVVGGTTKPTSPANNTIWVNTSTTITSWEVNPNTPTQTTNGKVWIYVGVSSDLSFNALKTNAIQLYPIEVYQYYSSKWNKMAAEGYQNGTWKSLLSELYLFNNGDTCDSSTGGWTAASGGSVGTTLDVANGGTGPTYIQYAQVITNKAIDFSQFNTLHINVSSYSSTGTVTISTTSGGSAAASVTINAKKEFTLNIADCDDAYFIKLRTEGKQHNSNSWLSTGFYADKIWLTKD